MGRGKGKLKLEYIADKKSRNLTLQRRKENLVKKAKELATLCDVDVCLVAYAPEHSAPIAVWGNTRRITDLYRAEITHNSKNVKTCVISDFKNTGQLVRRSRTHRLSKQAESMDGDHQFVGPIPPIEIADMHINNQDSSTSMIVPPVLMFDEGLDESKKQTTESMDSTCVNHHQFVGPIDHLVEQDSSTSMIVPSDPPVSMMGFFDEVCASTNDHDLYNLYDNNEILGQPMNMMTWPNDGLFMPTTMTTGPFDLDGGDQEGIKWADYLQCNLNFDDFWVPAV